MPRGNPTEQEIEELRQAIYEVVLIAIPTVAAFVRAVISADVSGPSERSVSMVTDGVVKLFVMADKARLLE